MKKCLNEGKIIHNFISSSGSGTVISYGSGSDFLTSYGSGSTSQKVTVPVPQHCPAASLSYRTHQGKQGCRHLIDKGKKTNGKLIVPEHLFAN
jgi:hypothetical protein